MHYLLLGLAIVCEVFATSMMKLSDGFRRKLPIIGIVAGYVAAFSLLGFAIRELPMGVAMGVWTGLGTALTAAVATIVWKEPWGARKCLGLALIVVGVFVLEVGARL